jgi:hypothetical protein
MKLQFIKGSILWWIPQVGAVEEGGEAAFAVLKNYLAGYYTPYKPTKETPCQP